ncbi:MAG: hypothetical protein V1855_00805 [bacterium]
MNSKSMLFLSAFIVVFLTNIQAAKKFGITEVLRTEIKPSQDNNCFDRVHSVSKDGRFVIESDFGGEMKIYNVYELEGNKYFAKKNIVKSNYHACYTISPCGKYLLISKWFFLNETEKTLSYLALHTIDTGVDKILYRGSYVISNAIFSPNGTHISFKIDQSIVLLNINTLQVKKLNLDKLSNVYNKRLMIPHVVSADNKNILLTLDQWDLYRKNICDQDVVKWDVKGNSWSLVRIKNLSCEIFFNELNADQIFYQAEKTSINCYDFVSKKSGIILKSDKRIENAYFTPNKKIFVTIEQENKVSGESHNFFTFYDASTMEKLVTFSIDQPIKKTAFFYKNQQLFLLIIGQNGDDMNRSFQIRLFKLSGWLTLFSSNPYSLLHDEKKFCDISIYCKKQEKL